MIQFVDSNWIRYALFWTLLLFIPCTSFTPITTNCAFYAKLHTCQIQQNMMQSALQSSTTSSDWIAGDWKKDLRALESGVAHSNAPTDFAQKERMDLLDEFARQRRDLIPDFMKFVLKPVAISLSLIAVSNHSIGRKYIQVFISLMNTAFWSISIVAPVLLHCISKKKSTERRRISEWSAEFVDSREDTSDHSRCLLENWAIASLPMAILGSVNVALRGLDVLPIGNLLAFHTATCVTQLMTRLGTVAAIHQFPKYNYDLRIERNKGPMPFLQSGLLTLVNLSLWTLPLGFSSDVCQLHLCQVQNFRFNMMQVLDVYRGGRLVKLFTHAALFSSLAMAICQLAAFQKIIRVGQFVNVSLATSESTAKILMQDPKAFQPKLRYKLQWREPRRLLSSFRRLAREFTLFLFSGWGEDASIVQESTAKPHLLRVIAKEMDENPLYQKRNREDWIPNATRGISAIHAENYDRKTFEDPLGIALHQTFGIGLSFDFEHDSKVKEGEMPSVHRLRARAAKSAIKRYYQIPDIVKADLQKNNIEDESILTRRVEEERVALKLSVVKLLTLIPSNSPSPEGKDLDVLSMRQSEVNSFSGKANLPFLEDDDFLASGKADNFIVTDPYLGDDIFDDEKKMFA